MSGMQQLFEQQDITTVICITHFHLWLHENHTSAREHGHSDWNRYTGTFLSESGDGHQWAEAASDWNVVSNQQSYIDQANDQWQDCFNACLKVKSKHWTFVMMCFCVTVMTLRHTLLLLWTNWLMFRFIRKGENSHQERRAFPLQIYFSRAYLCAKNGRNILWLLVVWQSYCKNKRVQFFAPPPTVYR